MKTKIEPSWAADAVMEYLTRQEPEEGLLLLEKEPEAARKSFLQRVDALLWTEQRILDDPEAYNLEPALFNRETGEPVFLGGEVQIMAMQRVLGPPAAHRRTPRGLKQKLAKMIYGDPDEEPMDA